MLWRRYEYREKVNKPNADDDKEIYSVVFRLKSPSCVDTKPPTICIIAKTIEDAFTLNDVPDLSKINDAKFVMITIPVACINQAIAKLVANPFKTVRFLKSFNSIFVHFRRSCSFDLSLWYSVLKIAFS